MKLKKTIVSLILGLPALVGCTDDNKVDDVVETDGATDSAAKGTGSGTGTATQTEAAKDEKTAENPGDKAASAESKEPASLPAAAAAPVASEAPSEAASSGTGYVSTEGLNVRQGPGISYPVVRVLGFGDQVTKLSSGSWIKIGESEFVYGSYIADSQPEAPVANPVVAPAKKAASSPSEEAPQKAAQELSTPEPASDSAPKGDSPSE